MAVKIRLKQTGKRNSRSFRVVAIDESKKRDGAVIEELGHVTSKHAGKQVTLKRERIDNWVKVGAQLSPTVSKLLTTP